MKNIKNPIKQELGMTLVEVLIAMVLLGIVAVAIFSGLSTSYKAYSVSQQHATAMALAQSQLESIEKETYSTAGYTKIAEPTGYTIAIPPPQELHTNLQKIVVSVTCPDGYVFTLETKKVQ